MCSLPAQKERRKRNPQQTSHNPKRGFQISALAFHPKQSELVTAAAWQTLLPVSSPGRALFRGEDQTRRPAGVRAWPEGQEGVGAPPG